MTGVLNRSGTKHGVSLGLQNILLGIKICFQILLCVRSSIKILSEKCVTSDKIFILLLTYSKKLAFFYFMC